MTVQYHTIHNKNVHENVISWHKLIITRHLYSIAHICWKCVCIIYMPVNISTQQMKSLASQRKPTRNTPFRSSCKNISYCFVSKKKGKEWSQCEMEQLLASRSYVTQKGFGRAQECNKAHRLSWCMLKAHGYLKKHMKTVTSKSRNKTNSFQHLKKLHHTVQQGNESMRGGDAS